MGKYQGYKKYKSSGVEWLGKIPEHWESVGLTKYLKSLVDYRGKTPEKSKDGVFLVTARNIKNGIIDYSLSQEFVKDDEYDEIMRRGKPEIGDVLLTTEAPLGEVANVDNTSIALAQRIIKMQGRIDRLDNYFLKYWILGSSFAQNLQSLCTGSTALGIKASKLCLLKVLLPPLDEQESIAHFRNRPQEVRLWSRF
jgi:type I restriction enzyme, S subunit